MKKKEVFLRQLIGIRSYLLNKIYTYKIEIKRFEISRIGRRGVTHFNERIQFLENLIATNKKLLDEEEKSPGYLERMKNKYLDGEKAHKKLQKIQPLLKPLDYKTYAKNICRDYDIEHIKKSNKFWEKAIVDAFDERKQYRVKEIRIELLKKKVENLTLKATKLKEFINEEFKKLNREENRNLFELFENMKNNKNG